jgi:hypothetical protein
MLRGDLGQALLLLQDLLIPLLRRQEEEQREYEAPIPPSPDKYDQPCSSKV